MATSSSRGAGETVSVGGHRLRLTNLDKVLYPATGTTKADVLAYLAAVADVMLPHCAHRPATRKRWPDGVDGQVFFQKNAGQGVPSWVRTRRIQHKSSANDYVLVDDLATLTWLGQTASLELHVPQWQFGRTGVHLNPDRLVLDLDPGPGAGLAECAEVARLARQILQGMGLDPLPVTSGSKGIHLYAALDGKQDAAAVSAVAHELARYLEAEHPDLVVSDMKKSLRGGKVLVDWSQNNGNKTTIAPYSLRGREHPTVAAPRTWEELDDPDLRHLDSGEVVERVRTIGDPLAALTLGHLSALEPTPERMATFERKGAATSGSEDDPGTSDAERPDRLHRYRSMRDAARTPEPVPDEAPPASEGNGFVIQEHHARRLHWDFRLEHDGVLVSWALPRGEPTDPKKNHLAVQTEDHPLAYGSFEGTIPKGEYGAGEVTIWDAGTYELEKWRDGKEVIVTLHGEQHGTRRLALIHTGGRDGRDGRETANWLIHLMAPRGGTPGAASAGGRDQGETKKAGGALAPGRGGSGGSAEERGADGRPGASAPPATPPDHDHAEPAPARTDWRPMLASPASAGDLHDGDDWAFEMKWDGFRALAHVSRGGVRLVSRSGKDMTVTYPELQALAEQVPAEALPVVLDGEIVALDARGRPSFRRLQQRANIAKPGDVAAARRKVTVDLMVFDVLETAGRSLAKRPYDERREILEDVLGDARAPVHVPPAFDGDLDAAMETSRRLGLEGVVAKRRDGTYSSGRRSALWLKLKHAQSQEVVVVGWRPGHGDRAHLMGSLLLAVPDGDRLVYVGRVGSGFTDAERHDLVTELGRLERTTPPATGVPRDDARDARWVSPRRVAEVVYAEWTGPGEGDDVPFGKLRHPVWKGWRRDKAPADVAREEPATLDR
ncbi:bifunctional non-homologous end joining protein LigD [Cellulosimicrobium cellulans]|uniref:ATP-dependent DNA ligase n=1 Tax=Cellulosimicrobium cellulans TaxID=1710 RepID=UPI00195AE474|nr:ATP-dependent DNA ligase [Cellulosimicrobium cellulans]MBM7820480.1 bifunctional non-homologous end joining protein LigD [Cellulosimicrobium cellulans]